GSPRGAVRVFSTCFSTAAEVALDVPLLAHCCKAEAPVFVHRHLPGQAQRLPARARTRTPTHSRSNVCAAAATTAHRRAKMSRLVVPAQEGRGLLLKCGDRVSVVDLEGHQIADLFAFRAD